MSETNKKSTFWFYGYFAFLRKLGMTMWKKFWILRYRSVWQIRQNDKKLVVCAWLGFRSCLLGLWACARLGFCHAVLSFWAFCKKAKNPKKFKAHFKFMDTSLRSVWQKFKIFSFIQSQYDKTIWYDWIWFWLKIEICLNFGDIMPFFRGFCFAPSYLLTHFTMQNLFLPNRYAIFDSLQWRADTDWEQMNFALGCHAKFTHTCLRWLYFGISSCLFYAFFEFLRQNLHLNLCRKKIAITLIYKTYK